jgi:hypothetical protein
MIPRRDDGSVHVRELAGRIFVVALVAAVIAVLLFPDKIPDSNWGFGPDWACRHPPNSEPICFKKPPAKVD